MYGLLLFQNLMSYVLKSNHALTDLRDPYDHSMF